MRQREMSLLAQSQAPSQRKVLRPIAMEGDLKSQLSQAAYVPKDVVTSWATYRDAVVWCWWNQRHHVGQKDTRRQLLFAEAACVHPPHMSRCVKPVSKAPMNLDPNVVPLFEAFTGWRGVSQWLALDGQQTLMEQVIQERAAA